MADNRIEVYQNNTKTINCTVSGLSLTGYTPNLTVKKNKSETVYLGKEGIVTDPSTAIFYLTPADTSLSPGDYIYDITFTSDSSIYTVTKDAFIILDGVKY